MFKTKSSKLRETDSDSHSTCSLVLNIGNAVQAIHENGARFEGWILKVWILGAAFLKTLQNPKSGLINVCRRMVAVLINV